MCTFAGSQRFFGVGKCLGVNILVLRLKDGGYLALFGSLIYTVNNLQDPQ